MAASVNAQALFETYRKRLCLQWRGGHSGGERAVGATALRNVGTLVGYLNPVRPHAVQIVGRNEIDYLNALGRNSYRDTIEHLFSGPAFAVIVCDGLEVPEEFVEAAERTQTPLFASDLGGAVLIEHLQYYVGGGLADKVVLHGVFMEVMGAGVLLAGPSGVGKSELALELISRGHRLIADDAPEFQRISPDIIAGSCPELLRGFMEVRGLGILNIRSIFGENAVKRVKYLRLIVNLQQMSEEDLRQLDRLEGSYRTQTILGVEVPEVILPVAPGRNLAVIVEVAISNHLLNRNGYNAAQDLIERQRRHMNSSES